MKRKGTTSLEEYVRWLNELSEGQIESCYLVLTPNGNLHYCMNVIVAYHE